MLPGGRQNNTCQNQCCLKVVNERNILCSAKVLGKEEAKDLAKTKREMQRKLKKRKKTRERAKLSLFDWPRLNPQAEAAEVKLRQTKQKEARIKLFVRQFKLLHPAVKIVLD